MKAKLNQFILCIKVYETSNITYHPGQINEIIDIDHIADRYYFGPNESITRPTNDLWFLLFDTYERAQEYWKRGTVSTVGKASYTEGDPVLFIVGDVTLKYTVKSSFLSVDSYHNNGQIFNLLGLDKFAFAEKIYGYGSDDGDEFPAYKYGDFSAASRIIFALKEKCLLKTKELNLESVIKSEKEYVAGLYPYTPVESKFEYTPKYPLGSNVRFDTGTTSFTYKINTHYMTCTDGWDAIYKALGVDPKSFIQKATGKPARLHGVLQAYGTLLEDWKSIDSLVDALKAECIKQQISVYTKTTSFFNLTSSLGRIGSHTTKKSSKLDVSLDGLEVKKLTIH
jgi:hypothetical protein